MDIISAMERPPEFAPVAAEGIFDEAATVFIGGFPKVVMAPALCQQSGQPRTYPCWPAAIVGGCPSDCDDSSRDC